MSGEPIDAQKRQLELLEAIRRLLAAQNATSRCSSSVATCA